MQKRLKPENRKIHCQWHVYIDTTHTIRHLFLTWTSSYPFSFLLNLNQTYAATRLLFLLLLTCITSELYSGIHQPWFKYKWNKIKSEHGSHIHLHTTYNLIMFTYNICKPDDKCRVNTDLPSLKSGEHKINNMERVTTPNMWTNNLHAVYMILCEMREWFDG